MVADGAEVCPDCGMELGAPPSPTPAATAPPAATPASAPVEGSIGGGSGFTVDFGFDAAPTAPTSAATPDFTSAFDAPSVDAPSVDAFDFGGAGAGNPGAGSTVAIDPISLEKVPPPPPIAAAQTAQIALKRAGSLTGDAFPFGPGSIVGRFDPDSGPVDVDLAPLPEASYVSRHHAEFRHDAGSGAWFIRDMGSSNGTFWRAGGQGAFSRLAGEQAVQSGDEIALGNARFEFKTL